MFLACLCTILILQIWNGAYQLEKGQYSDDASHFMNGMVLRDYLQSAIGENPIRFAESYYMHYPKIAPLMWPPLFHVGLGVFLLPGWAAGPASLVFVALLGAWLAWRLHRIVAAMAGGVAAWLAVILLLATPLVQEMAGVVMLDLALAAIALEAAYWLAQYAGSGARKHAVWFGAFAAAACLTKGNGIAVVLMPAVFIVMARRFDLLRRSGLYIAAAIVIAFAVPFLMISTRLDAAIGDFGPLTATLLADRIRLFATILWTQMGPLVLVPAAAVSAMALQRHAGSDKTHPPYPAVLLALTGGAILFHLFSPHQLTLTRYFTMAIAPVAGLAAIGIARMAERARQLEFTTAARTVAVAALVVVVPAGRPAATIKHPLGYREAVRSLTASQHLAAERVLIVSDEIGEGAFVTEMATLELAPAPTIIRGSKLLASDDWSGHHFQLRYASAAALLADLESLHIGYVVLDQTPRLSRRPYFDQVQTLADTESKRFQQVYASAGNEQPGKSRRRLAVYRLTSPKAGPAKRLEVNLAYSLGRSLTR